MEIGVFGPSTPACEGKKNAIISRLDENPQQSQAQTMQVSTIQSGSVQKNLNIF